MAEEWAIDEVFDDDYLYFYAGLLSDEVADAQTSQILDLLEIEPGARVLDLACGHGRIANRLAAAGFEVVGLDATPLFLDRARSDAAEMGVAVDYRLGDMRDPDLSAEFDAIVCWFTAFGYFDDEQNRRVLTEARRALRPGGRFLVELNHKDAILTMLEPESRFEMGPDSMEDHRSYDPLTGRMHTRRVVTRGGETREARFFVRMFAPTELRDWLLAAGFADVRLCGAAGETLTLSSRRLIAIATAPT